MRALLESEIMLINGGDIDREAVVAGGTIVGGLLGSASKIPNGGLYGSAAGGYVAGKGYDVVANSPTITIPNVNVNPGTQGTPSYISRPGMNSSIYGN
ncbi:MULTISPECIES: hypothetical protein [Serratia]|uniref:hypothetical protein n=1 Tax=Serratia TaxID=613 RepID=UPI000936AB10|nr:MULTISPECIES: hypothetical protein [Serratia]OJT44153.1 hypothetical protein BSR04_05545 [Serratia plymuthica]RYM56076.1 hypothetical protein BSQ96_05085 [Serratia proteamaculans]